MSFRSDVPVTKTRKAGRCSWCGEKIPVGTTAMRSQGYGEDFWSARFHNECWRAEIAYWGTKPAPEEPPEEPQPRGVTLDYYGDVKVARWKPDPVTWQEAVHPHSFHERMRLLDPEIDAPECLKLFLVGSRYRIYLGGHNIEVEPTGPPAMSKEGLHSEWYVPAKWVGTADDIRITEAYANQRCERIAKD